MKGGARIAVGVAIGYFLGRTKKMKLAMMLAGGAATRQAGGPSGILGQGVKLLGQSPEVLRLNDELRGRLVDVGKSAALAVATRQVDELTNRLSERLTSVSGAAEPVKSATAPVKKAVKKPSVGRPADEDADADDEDQRDEEQEDEEYEDEDEDEEPEAETAQSEDEDEDADEDADGDDADEDEEPPPAKRPGRAVKRTGTGASGTARSAAKAVPGRRSSRSQAARRSGSDD